MSAFISCNKCLFVCLFGRSMFLSEQVGRNDDAVC